VHEETTVTTPNEPERSDPLRPALREAEAQLRDRLEEACETDDVTAETTGELIRLEDSLLAAARAAKEAITLRRRLRQGSEPAPSEHPSDRPVARDAPTPGQVADRKPGAEQVAVDAGGTTQHAESAREFTDRSGRAWYVWAVKPGEAREVQRSTRVLGEFGAGWLLFEAADGTERRRLPDYPAEWRSLDDRVLEELLQRAVSSKVRRHGERPGGEEPAP
jgi:hypothetical protein